MGRFDGVLLCSDFDGTVFSDGHVLPPRNRAALDHFVAQGGWFTVATGRTQHTFRPYAHLVPCNAPAILSNGSVLYDLDREEILLETQLDARAGEDLAALCRAIPELALEAYCGTEIYAHNPNWITQAHMVKVSAHYTLRPIAHMPAPWLKALLQQERPVLERAKAWLLEYCGDRYEAIFSNPNYLEITAKGSTKGGLALELARRLGVAREDLYCVGDNENDLSMLAVSQIPFAPGDCAAEVRAIGPRLLCPCDEGAMGDLVEILEGIYR